MRIFGAAVCILFVLSTCITPVPLDPDEPENDILVMDGFITDQPGQYEVVLSRITKFASVSEGGAERFDREAEVFITDQNGNRTDFTVQNLTRKEITNPCADFGGCCPTPTQLSIQSLGFRSPENFHGEVGSTYTLTVITFNGRIYQSTPQTIIAGPPIDSISYRYKQLPSADAVTFGSGVEIFSTWQDPAETSDFYAWRINGTYKIETPDNPAVCCMRDPTDNGETLCYIEEKNVPGSVLSFSDVQSNGARITQSVGFVEDDGFRFANTNTPPVKQYFVEVEQWALSSEAFAFTERLSSQLEIDGDIFDPPPAQIQGNISNINDPDELVVGFFGAYSVQKKGLFIDRNDLEFVQPFPGGCNDCRTRPFATTELPDVFRD